MNHKDTEAQRFDYDEYEMRIIYPSFEKTRVVNIFSYKSFILCALVSLWWKFMNNAG